MKVIIAGSRTITDYSLVEQAVKDSGFDITEVVSGCCDGVDQLGETWAFRNGLEPKEFPANWKKYGTRAGPIRNREMAEYVGSYGGLILVWTGKSRGSSDMLVQAVRNGLKIYQKVVDVT